MPSQAHAAGSRPASNHPAIPLPSPRNPALAIDRRTAPAGLLHRPGVMPTRVRGTCLLVRAAQPREPRRQVLDDAPVTRCHRGGTLDDGGHDLVVAAKFGLTPRRSLVSPSHPARPASSPRVPCTIATALAELARIGTTGRPQRSQLSRKCGSSWSTASNWPARASTLSRMAWATRPSRG